jgi:2-keto-4-pentenoate hydratase/2-oxohepta-3-ene-1,7-dioic acid hydratase in catechol pathway
LRLATIEVAGAPAAAVIRADGAAVVLDGAAAAAAGLAADDPGLSGDLAALIARGRAGVEAARKVAESAAATVIPAERVRLLAPLRPRKNVFCVGRNYADHIAEGARAQNVRIDVTEVPVFFTKPPTAVIGPGAAVPIFPHVSEKIDYEVELAVVIGTAGRDIPRESALDHVFGYTILNDISARDVQRRHGGQYFKGKGLDGSCPLGPWVVTADAIPDPAALGIRLRVNGELRQDSTTAAMIFDIPTLIASLSEGMTLEPGDIIATGTPSGVGYAMDPPRFLADGDTVSCEIDGIGTLENPVRVETRARRVA